MNAVTQLETPGMLSRLFARDLVRWDGVRPIQVYLLRLLYALMFIGVGIQTWAALVNHQGPWDHVRAIAFCVWAAYPTLGLLGLRQPLRMLPLVVFMVFYKTLWLAFVAYPLWQAGQLAGPTAEMARVFIGVLAIYPIIPWGYVYRQFVQGRRAPAA